MCFYVSVSWLCFAFAFSSVLLKVCVLLKNRAQEVRDIARSTLTKIIEDLGVHFLQYVLKELQTTLVRGYQVSVAFHITQVSTDFFQRS